MAAEAGNAALVHLALHEVVALHPVLVRRAVREVREGCFAEGMLLELPELAEPSALMKADGPVEVLPRVRVRQWLPLRVALNARIVRAHQVEFGGVDDVPLRRLADVRGAGSVAAF